MKTKTEQTNMSKILIILSAVMFSHCAGVQPPTWYNTLPSDGEYYHGIGIVEKTEDTDQDYRQAAKNLALADISSQIRVNIESELSIETSENAEGVSEQIDLISKNRTEAVLTGVEQVEVFETKTSYGIYMRLAKSVYEQESQKTFELAISEAENYLNLASGQDVDPLQVLQYQLYALEKLNSVRDLMTRFDKTGTSAKSYSSTRSALAQWFSQIKLEADRDRVEWVIPSGLDAAISLFAKRVQKNMETVPIQNLPILVTFGEKSVSVQTNEAGQVSLETSHFGHVNGNLIMRIEPDRNALLEGRPDLAPFLSSIQLPSIQLNLVVRGPSIELRSSEKGLNKPLRNPYISPIIKSSLQKLIQAEFVDGFTKTPADFVIRIESNSVESGPAAELYGKTIYKCFSSVEINIQDANGEQTLYTTHLQDVSGAAFSGFEAASQQSYAKLAKKFEDEIIPEILNIFQGEGEQDNEE